mgnify:CR=1 FL=1
MKKTLYFIGRLLVASVLIALSAVSGIGVLAYYQEKEALPFAIFGAICFCGALAMSLHEESKPAPTAKTKTTAAATDEVAAA